MQEKEQYMVLFNDINTVMWTIYFRCVCARRFQNHNS